MAGRKIFVGSLPTGIDDGTIRQEFSKYGVVEDVFIKPNCDAGRQWAFVTFQSADQANFAKDSCDRILHFPGTDRPCDVMLAKNQGMFGQDPLGSANAAIVPGADPGPRKIFVGSLPDGCHESLLRSEFQKYGQIEEVYMKPNCESGRQWAFVTFTFPQQAAAAAASANGLLQFAGSFKPCEVTLAKNQGLFGQDAINGGNQGGPQLGYGGPQQQGPFGQDSGMGGNQGAFNQGGHPPAYGGPQQQTFNAPSPNPGGVGAARKIFVGSLPDHIQDHQLRDEFNKYGQVTDVYLKTGCQPGRQWAFVNFDNPEQAQYAKESCDRRLMFPGSVQPCEVTIAKNQGMFGQGQVSGPGVGGGNSGKGHMPPPQQQQGYQDPMMAAGGPGQPPPPAGPPPAHLTPWRQYKTVSGIPYYHNQQTGATVWECPPDLQAQGANSRYSPY